MTAFSGVVLTGGSSRRMGTNKARLLVDGQPMALRVADALRSAGAAEILICGRPNDVESHTGVTAVADRWPGQGPLGGIISALHAVTTTRAMVLATDLVEPSVEAIVEVTSVVTDADVVLPAGNGGRHYLHACWQVGSVEHLESVFATGIRSVGEALVGLRVEELNGIPEAALTDADRPEDLPTPGT